MNVKKLMGVVISVVGDTGIRITGRKQGETTLRVWTKDGARKAYRLAIQG